MTERSSGTRYSRKNSGGTPPSKPYPLSQQLPDRGSKASKCRPTKLIPLPRQRPADRGSKASKCRPTKLILPPTSATRRQRKRSFQMSSVLHKKKITLPIHKERRTNNDNNKIQRQTYPNPYINPNHHLPHHPQLQPNPCSSRTQRGHNPERVLPYHNPVTR